MKVVCVNTKSEGLQGPWDDILTLNKIYDGDKVTKEHSTHLNGQLIIMCDDDRTRYFSSDRFITLEEYRNKQLDSILNEI